MYDASSYKECIIKFALSGRHTSRSYRGRHKKILIKEGHSARVLLKELKIFFARKCHLLHLSLKIPYVEFFFNIRF